MVMKQSEQIVVEQEAVRWLASPLGTLRVQASNVGITHVAFSQGCSARAPLSSGYHLHNQAHHWLDQLEQQLHEYFYQHANFFQLPLAPHGTPFQQQVWQQLQAIPHGETRSYGQLAAALGKPKGAQAVGQANGANPIAIIIPCHRVIQGDGSLGGYAGGLERKQWLLTHEQIDQKQ